MLGRGDNRVSVCGLPSVAAAILFLLSFSLHAATSVSGPITTNTVWTLTQSPFEVTSDVTISEGATLTVEPGVTVFFESDTNLIVQSGTLRAFGTSALPIVFTASADNGSGAPIPGSWGSVKFLNGTNDSLTILEHVKVRYGRGVIIESASPTLNYVTLTNNNGPAISVDLNASPLGVGLQASGNLINGILVPAGEITGTVTWGLQGIPYVVDQGVVSIGRAPTVTSVLPNQLAQGQTTTLTVQGSRLSGAERIQFDDSTISATVLPGGSDTSFTAQVSASSLTSEGPVGVDIQVAGGKLRLNSALTIIPPKPPIVVASLSPGSIRRGETKSFQATGQILAGASVTTSAAGLTISNVSTTSTAVNFSLTASGTAALGDQAFIFTNLASASGSATQTISVLEAPPTVVTSPAPIAAPPDNLPHQIRIRISKADTVEHSFALTIANTAIATISPANVTIPIGSTEAIATITGRAIGQTSLTLTSSTLGTLVAPVFITTEFSGLNTSYSTLVGVVLEQAPTPPSSTNITPLVSSNVGVVVGNHIAAINPNTLTVGTGPVSLVITGAGLQDVTSVQFNPSDGLSLGAFSANPDGQSLVIPVTVAANAPTTQREVVVLAGTVRYPAISPTAGRVKVVLPPPEVHSLDPMFATPGTSGLVLTVRGRYLSDLQSVTVSPADGVSVGAASVNADGTVVTVGLEISASTIPGQRVITVTTLGGTSSAVASSANTFAIVASSQIRDFVAPITAPIVGVVLEQEAQPPVQQSLSLAAASVGVTLGSVVTGINPMAGSIGETVALTVTGNELQGVSEVRLVPNSGVTVSSPTVAEDGKSLTVNITIALDAPQTLRTLQVVKAATVLPAAPISATQFRVTTPQPEIHAVSPLFLQVGQTPASLSIHGKNFQNLQQIRVLPANDVSIGAPSISSDGISITVNVAATAGATLGPRVVIVETAAGSTSTTGTIANTITLTNTAGTTYAPIAAPLVGVLLEQSPSPPISTDIGPITAANVGVMLEQAPLPPVPTSMFLPSSVVGVTIGSVATQIQPTGAIAGSSITLLVRGLELNQITGIAFNPSAGVVIGTVQVNGDGTELTVPLDVTVNAASGWREVILNTPSGAITFVDPAQGRFYVAAGAPIFSSISPIFGTQGGVVNLTINGQNLNSAIAMTAVPSEGISFGNAITVNATGTQLNVQMQISASAPTTARAIRVTTPAAISSEVATPVNTFTVFPP